MMQMGYQLAVEETMKNQTWANKTTVLVKFAPLNVSLYPLYKAQVTHNSVYNCTYYLVIIS